MAGTGKVFLIGGGPGDPGLVTVRGLDALRRADAVVYDALAPAALLDETREGAERIDAGKRGGEGGADQAEISALLVRLAGQGKVVARLKGGDPFVFGRGGEEALALRRAGVEFEVVPGVTAGVGAAAFAGAPVTHRGVSSSVLFVTGHEDAGKGAGSINWRAAAQLGGTICVYMAARSLRRVAEELTAGGMAPDTPCLAVRWGTTPAQRCVETTLARVETEAGDLGPPLMLLVGEAARLRGELRWFERRPLFGKRVVVTRPRLQSAGLSGLLREQGAEALAAPAIRVEPLENASSLDGYVAGLGGYDWVVFASANAVEAVFGRMAALELDARAFGRARVAAAGAGTARRLREFGVRADVAPAPGGAEAARAEMRRAAPAGGRALVFRSNLGRGGWAEMRGWSVDETPAYRTVMEERLPVEARRRLEAGEADYVTFASGSAARGFARAAGAEGRWPFSARLASLGPETSRVIRDMGWPEPLEALEASDEGLVAAVAEDAARRGRDGGQEAGGAER